MRAGAIRSWSPPGEPAIGGGRGALLLDKTLPNSDSALIVAMAQPLPRPERKFRYTLPAVTLYRGSGLLPTILESVCEYADSAGYPIVEGYPIEPRDGKRAVADSVMTGIASAFLEAGFAEVSRPHGCSGAASKWSRVLTRPGQGAKRATKLRKRARRR